MDAMFAVKLVQAHNLNDAMIGSLRTGTLSEPVKCQPRRLGALIGRGLVDPESHTLTLLGDLLCRAFSGEDLTDEERRDVLSSVASRASTRGGGYVVDTSGIDSNQGPEMARTAVLGAIRPAKDGEEGVPWTAAKRELERFFAKRRDFDRTGIQNTKSLTKRDLMEAQQVEPFTEEPLFQAPVA